MRMDLMEIGSLARSFGRLREEMRSNEEAAAARRDELIFAPISTSDHDDECVACGLDGLPEYDLSDQLTISSLSEQCPTSPEKPKLAEPYCLYESPSCSETTQSLQGAETGSKLACFRVLEHKVSAVRLSRTKKERDIRAARKEIAKLKAKLFT